MQLPANGNHIGYNEVYISQANNGYSLYRYYGSDIWDNLASGVAVTSITNTIYCDPSTPNYPSAPPAFEPMRGELKSEGHYNQNGDLLKEVKYVPEYTQNPKPTPGHISIQNQVFSSFTDYTLYTYHKTKDQRVTNNYVPGGGYLTDTSTTYYASNYHHEPTRTVIITSTRDSIVTNLKYAFDLRANCDTITDSLTHYLSSVNTAYSNFASTTGTCTPQNVIGPGNCRFKALIDLRYDISLARIKYMKYLKRNYSNINSIFNTCHSNAKSAAGSELKPILELQDEYQNPVIEESQWKDTSLLFANFTRFDTVINPLGKVYPNKIQLINLLSLSASFTNVAVSGNTITKDSRYKDEASYLFSAGNPIQTAGHSGVTRSYIWDYSNTEPIAKISGAANDQVAYTSFESDGKGNWSFTGTPGVDYTTPTGKKSYTLTGSNNITKSGLSSGKTYIISYWAKSNSALSITGTISDYPIAGRTFGVWKYFEHHITGQTSVTITGSVAIDELRLYPLTAQMATYTYDPLIGMSSQCDANNRISYYEYDALGRLVLIRDQDKNIVKSICYNYAGQTENCHINTIYLNNSISQNITRNNCSAGQIASTVTYTIPQGKYTSTISQHIVDSLVQVDISTSGQSYANTYGTCICDTTDCNGSNANYKCINGACEKGTLVCVSSVFNSHTHLWTCTYRYRFSDCTENFAYTTQNFSSCTLDHSCP